jgi:hypothetical protein
MCATIERDVVLPIMLTYMGIYIILNVLIIERIPRRETRHPFDVLPAVAATSRGLRARLATPTGWENIRQLLKT